MNEAILRHLAYTQSLLETVIKIHVALMAPKMGIPEDDALRNLLDNVERETEINLEKLKQKLS